MTTSPAPAYSRRFAQSSGPEPESARRRGRACGALVEDLDDALPDHPLGIDGAGTDVRSEHDVRTSCEGRDRAFALAFVDIERRTS